MSLTSASVGVEFRLGKIRRRFPEDLVRAFQLTNLGLKLDDPALILGVRPGVSPVSICHSLNHDRSDSGCTSSCSPISTNPPL